MSRWTCLLLALLCNESTPAFAAPEATDGKTRVRLLHSFENADEVKQLAPGTENASLEFVRDKGVTQGKGAVRLTVPRGAEYGSLTLDAAALKGWGAYDYFAIDVTTDDDHPYALNFELWDRHSKNYASRCTWENVATKRGKQTLVYPIARARRNGKERLAWDELEPEDKIDRAALTKVKLFLTPRKDRDAVLWIDNVRLIADADAGESDGSRTGSRLLYSFESGEETKALLRDAENVALDVVQDNGVTQGKNCARLTVPRGAEYGFFKLDPALLKGWGEYDYFAIDVFTEDEHPYALNFELWDGQSKNYATRCTYENITSRLGRQTLLYPIRRARRNGKEGLDWAELRPEDKIDRDNLTQVKIFLTPRKDRDAVLWIDNVRLLQEDAARPRLRVPLPEGAIAFKFGSAGTRMPGFRTISPRTLFTPEKGAGFVRPAGLTHGGTGWPDLLAGTFVVPAEGAATTFRAQVHNGDYFLWLCAGPVFRSEPKSRYFQLKTNNVTFMDALPSVESYYGDDYLYRFWSTLYSEKPHALWNNYIDRMYPVHVARIRVRDQAFTLTTVNHFLSGAVLVPASLGEKEWDSFVGTVRRLRIEAFERTLRPLTHKKPQRQPGDGPYLCYEPAPGNAVLPWTGPTAAERKRTSLKLAAAPGQLVTLRLAVVPFEDLVKCRLEASALKGPATLDAGFTVHLQNDRYDGDQLSEMALLPQGKLDAEKGVTRCYWLTLTVPSSARAGIYRGSVTFRPERGEARQLPVELEVYPFKLESVLPASLGMYYQPPRRTGLGTATEKRLLREQLQWMRQIGLTAVQVPAPYVTAVDRGRVTMRIDSTLYDLARAVGMGRHPRQQLMTQSLSIARGIGHRLPDLEGILIDRNPGIELRHPGLRPAFLNALGQFRAYIEHSELPVAVEIVDEPRETPNPWNRNLADTLTYADLLHRGGLRTFVTPMADRQDGKDYTVLADHADVVSVHGYPGSAGLIRRTHANRRTLWLYNTGMDRFSWGFYSWRLGASGRWEWHFCWPEDTAQGGYPGRDWFNPFTGSHGFAAQAPLRFPGAMLYQSKFLDVAEGINDYAYLYMLERALERSEAAGKKPDVVKEAHAFLASLRRAIPEFPGTKGLTSAEDGARVGLGIDDDVRLHAHEWRAKVAGFLKELRP